jgi:hypothetical protein
MTDSRGVAWQLETVTNRSSQLSAETRRFKDKATSLYRELLLRQWAPILVVVGLVLLLLYIFWR